MHTIITFSPKDITGTEYSYYLEGSKIKYIANTQSSSAYFIGQCNNIRQKFDLKISSANTKAIHLIRAQLLALFTSDKLELCLHNCNKHNSFVGKHNHNIDYFRIKNQPFNVLDLPSKVRDLEDALKGEFAGVGKFDLPTWHKTSRAVKALIDDITRRD